MTVEARSDERPEPPELAGVLLLLSVLATITVLVLLL